MAKLFVIAGHGAGDSGAVGNGYKEADCVRQLAQRIKNLGGSSVTLGDVNRNYYADNGISSLNIAKDFELLELHLDSSVSASARGGHVIINAGLKPDNYDNALANWLNGYFPGRSQTIDARNDLANPRRAASAGYSYRLVESCFISNTDDIRKLMGNIDTAAKGILSAFGIGSVPPPQPFGGCPYAEPSAALKQGSSGEGVRWIQWHLNETGAGLKIDASFGPATNTAVRNFQRNYELTIDGIVGPATRYALKAAVAVSATSPTPAPTPAPKPVCPYSEPAAALKQGSSGDGVRWIQWHLNQFGAGLKIDASFGPATNTAVRNFQSGKGLAVDGIVGPATRAALKKF